MRRGERVEALAHVAGELNLVPVGRRDRHGDDRVRRHDLGKRRTQRHTFDGALEQVGQMPGRFQGRRHLLALVDGEKNALHGTFPAE
jgi:hypothetical protein